MRVDVTTTATINCSVDVVAMFAADPANAPRWYANIREVVWRTTPPLRVGSRIAFVAQFLGRRLEYTYEVRSFDPAFGLVMATAEGPFPMETTYAWRAESQGTTQFTLRNRGEASGFNRLLAPLMAVAVRRENRRDVARLKSLLETAAGHGP